MKQLIGNEINGLQTEDGRLFLVQECVREEIKGRITKHTVCTSNTSCREATVIVVKIFNTPYGMVELTHNAWGERLEQTNSYWYIVGTKEVEALACKAMEAAKLANELAEELRKMKNK